MWLPFADLAPEVATPLWLIVSGSVGAGAMWLLNYVRQGRKDSHTELLDLMERLKALNDQQGAALSRREVTVLALAEHNAEQASTISWMYGLLQAKHNLLVHNNIHTDELPERPKYEAKTRQAETDYDERSRQHDADMLARETADVRTKMSDTVRRQKR